MLFLMAVPITASAYLPRLYEHSQILFWEQVAAGVNSEDFKFAIAADPHNVYPRFTNVLKAAQADGAFFGHIHTYDAKQIFAVPSFIAGVAGCTNIDWDIGDPGFGYLMCYVVNGVASYSRVDLVTKELFKSANY